MIILSRLATALQQASLVEQPHLPQARFAAAVLQQANTMPFFISEGAA
jgi:hypothetical protein